MTCSVLSLKRTEGAEGPWPQPRYLSQSPKSCWIAQVKPSLFLPTGGPPTVFYLHSQADVPGLQSPLWGLTANLHNLSRQNLPLADSKPFSLYKTFCHPNLFCIPFKQRSLQKLNFSYTFSLPLALNWTKNLTTKYNMWFWTKYWPGREIAIEDTARTIINSLLLPSLEQHICLYTILNAAHTGVIWTSQFLSYKN